MSRDVRDRQIYHSDMAKIFRCKYCGRTFPSMQGQRSHLAQAKKCHNKWQADLDTLQIASQNNARRANNEGAPAEDHPAIDEPDGPYVPEPADEAPVLEEQRHQSEHSDHDAGGAPSSKPRWRDPA